MATYKIHPGIGIARVGNSEDEFYLAPEAPAAMPNECDDWGNPLTGADGVTPILVSSFKDSEGRIKRQAARFQVYVYDKKSPNGRPLVVGDPVEGGGNHGKLVDIQWRVHLANKKSSWYQFNATQGEHGYPLGHPRRNGHVEGNARDRLIIDPGPRIVNHTDRRRAQFDRSGDGVYATTFPPAKLRPYPIDTLGEILTDDTARLIVLGGHGKSGCVHPEPHINSYANTDGWYDDVSDGPVMARLVMFSKRVQRDRYIDVAYPAWVIVGYPRFVPQILDIVTMDDVVYDLSLREQAADTGLYGRLGSFDCPEVVDPRDVAALRHWKNSRLAWNPRYKPGFYRDVWPILFRPDEFRWLTDVLAQSNFPHDQEQRGLFDPEKLGKTPRCVDAGDKRRRETSTTGAASAPMPGEDGEAPAQNYWDEHGNEWYDESRALRHFMFGLLRLGGEENEFKLADKVSSRLHNLPLMPLLCGDNPLTNIVPSKFLRLTDYQLFILKQWADGYFFNEAEEGILPDDYNRFFPYTRSTAEGGTALDRGVLSNVLGGAFCPGGEVGWIMRNPSIYREPYRITADRTWSNFIVTAAQSNTATQLEDFTFYVNSALSHDNNFDQGLQPGDLTKYMALPWQADFNECSTNNINVTYDDWNLIDPQSEGDSRPSGEEQTWETLWWPAHRPMQSWELISGIADDEPAYAWTVWSRGIPQTKAGDLKMVLDWWKLGFVIRNPYLPDSVFEKASTGRKPKFISIERS